mmetsp:Transcript_45111/g.142035  ORF Transcript_45111/g.142035 Transcript_45111/m.142035 type:complete len:108 (-) Transcript_45111:152-475(-)
MRCLTAKTKGQTRIFTPTYLQETWSRNYVKDPLVFSASTHFEQVVRNGMCHISNLGCGIEGLPAQRILTTRKRQTLKTLSWHKLASLFRLQPNSSDQADRSVVNQEP